MTDFKTPEQIERELEEQERKRLLHTPDAPEHVPEVPVNPPNMPDLHVNTFTLIFNWAWQLLKTDYLTMYEGNKSMTINAWTNIVAFLLVILEPVHSYLATTPFSWVTFLTTVGTALIGYFVGKKDKPQ